MSPPNTIITLKSCDGQTFHIGEAIVLQSRTLSTVVANNYGKTNILIPLNNVSGNILKKVIQYCTIHADNKCCSYEKEMKNWDAHFVNVNAEVLRELKKAANFLPISDLVDLLSCKMAHMIDGKTLEEIHILFPGMVTQRVEDYGDSECQVRGRRHG